MSGRASRMEWWVVFLVAAVVGSKAFGFANSALLAPNQRLADAALMNIIALAIIHAVIVAGILWVQVRVSVRRAHDRDKEAKWIWLYAAAYAVLTAVDFVLAAFAVPLLLDPAWIWAPTATLFGWMVIQFGIQTGSRGENRWGPVPEPYFDIGKSRSNNYRPPS